MEEIIVRKNKQTHEFSREDSNSNLIGASNMIHFNILLKEIETHPIN